MNSTVIYSNTVRKSQKKKMLAHIGEGVAGVGFDAFDQAGSYLATAFRAQICLSGPAGIFEDFDVADDIGDLE